MLTLMTQCEVEIDNDTSLVRAVKQGDIAAFEQLMARHSAKIFRVTMHILNSREDAEDVTQEAFLKAFQNLHTFEERARFSTWLTRIAVNSALMKLRVLRPSRTDSLDEESEDSAALLDAPADWRPNPEQLYRKTELKEILLEGLASLSQASRVVFVLRDIEGLSTSETSEMLDLSIDNVKSRLLQARLKLRGRLSTHFENCERPSVQPEN